MTVRRPPPHSRFQVLLEERCDGAGVLLQLLSGADRSTPALDTVPAQTRLVHARAAVHTRQQQTLRDGGEFVSKPWEVG